MKPPPLTPLGVGVSLVLFIGSVGGGLLAVTGVARGQVDAGLAPFDARVAVLEATAKDTAERLRGLEVQGARQEVKLDLILAKWQIPNPSPLARRDGGVQ